MILSTQIIIYLLPRRPVVFEKNTRRKPACIVFISLYTAVY